MANLTRFMRRFYIINGGEKSLTKDELLNGLNNILNTFLYGFVCPNLVPPDAWKDV